MKIRKRNIARKSKKPPAAPEAQASGQIRTSRAGKCPPPPSPCSFRKTHTHPFPDFTTPTGNRKSEKSAPSYALTYY